MAQRASENTVEFEYAGKIFVADAKAANSWSIAKAFSAANDGAQLFGAFDKLFCGKADEYAEMLDDDLQDMALLANAAFEAAKAKNS